MNERERRLTLLVGLAVALWLGHRGYNAYRDAVDGASEEQIAAETALAEAKLAVTRGMAARSRLNKWRNQSLPANPDVAEALYQDWLKKTILEAGLKISELRDRSHPSSDREQQEIETNVEAEGTLDQFVQFLQAFYGAGHLQRISQVTLMPTDDRRQIKISMNVDGLILTDCPRKDALAAGKNSAISDSLADAAKAVSARNLFLPYTPPTAPSTPAEAVAKSASSAWADNPEAAQARLTMIGKGTRGPYVSVLLSPSGRVRNYRVGQTIVFGELHASIVLIDAQGRRLIVATPQGTFEVRLGQKFSEASAVDPPPIEA